MIKHLIAASLLFLSAPALACNGRECPECDKHATATADASTPPADVTGTRGALSVSGMSCGACSAKVTAALKATSGVKWAFVDHEHGTADVIFDDQLTTLDALAKVVKETGFEAALVN